MINVECRNNLIRDLQCKFADYVKLTTDAMAYGKKNQPCLKQNTILVNLFIGDLYCYHTFTETVQAAFSFTINNPELETADFTINLEGTDFTITSSSDGQSIVQALYNLINETTVSGITWYSETNGNVLYIWTYDTGSTLPVSSSTGTETEINQSNIIDNLEEILDIWNCLSFDEICSNYEFANSILKKENCNCNG
jgi:hypothetical protein